MKGKMECGHMGVEVVNNIFWGSGFFRYKRYQVAGVD
jgi:hypothetical protein